jgi:hypothetical protein
MNGRDPRVAVPPHHLEATGFRYWLQSGDRFAGASGQKRIAAGRSATRVQYAPSKLGGTYPQVDAL